MATGQKRYSFPKQTTKKTSYLGQLKFMPARHIMSRAKRPENRRRFGNRISSQRRITTGMFSQCFAPSFVYVLLYCCFRPQGAQVNSFLSFMLQSSHFYSCNSCFITFISMLSSGSVNCLLLCICCQDTKNKR